MNIHGIVIEQKDNKDFEEKEEIYSTYKLLNLMSSIINDEKYEDDENYENEKTIINDDYGNLSDSKIIFSNNINISNDDNILKKNTFGNKEKKEVENLKNGIEKKLGKDFTNFLINYVSNESDKKSIQFDQKNIVEKLRNDFSSKKLNVLNGNLNLLNKGIELLPNIFSVIIAKRIEEDN